MPIFRLEVTSAHVVYLDCGDTVRGLVRDYGTYQYVHALGIIQRLVETDYAFILDGCHCIIHVVFPACIVAVSLVYFVTEREGYAVGSIMVIQQGVEQMGSDISFSHLAADKPFKQRNRMLTVKAGRCPANCVNLLVLWS